MMHGLEFLKGARVTIMGLGLHGGGLAAARFCAARGARVLVTDLRTREELASSVEALADLEVELVLGTHREQDFFDTDIIIKNPAVRRTAPLLAGALERGIRVETDISLFLRALCASRPDCRLIAVTGTKGKSSTASAVHHLVQESGRASWLGGNITISPLNFLDEVLTEPSESPVVTLELSSFQIGDLRLVTGEMHRPVCSIITNIYRDHQDYYPSMESYVADKALLFSLTDRDGICFSGKGGIWTGSFRQASAGTFVDLEDLQTAAPGAAGSNSGPAGLPPLHELVPEKLLVPGAHQRGNLYLAGLAALSVGVPTAAIRRGLTVFRGVEHRLYYAGSLRGAALRVYNDSAATIPEACLAAVSAFGEEPVHLICGGTDKNLDLSLMIEAAKLARSVTLLKGSASDQLTELFRQKGITFSGPYDDFSRAIDEAVGASEGEGMQRSILLLSPGCASFGMFKNEFDRGRQFLNLISNRPDYSAQLPV